MLHSLTFLGNLVALAAGLWLALYVVTRSPRRWISWLTGLTLLSLSSHFLNILLALAPLPTAFEAPTGLASLLRLWVGAAPDRANAWLQGWLIIPAIVFWHHATTLLYAPYPGSWRTLRLLAGYGAAVAAAIVQLGAVPLLAALPGEDPLYLSALKAGPLYPFFLALGLAYIAASLANLAGSARTAPAPILRKQFVVLIWATLLASLVAVLSVFASILGLRVPAVASSVLLGLGMALLGYGVARYSALVEGRTIRRDFYHAAAATGLATALHLVLASVAVHHLGAPPIAYALTVLLGVTTHFLVDAARTHRDAALHRRDIRQAQTGLHRLAGQDGVRHATAELLSVMLESLCTCARAIYGLVLLFEESGIRLAAVYGWPHSEPRLSQRDLAADDVLHLGPGRFPSPLAEAALLIPLYGGGEQFGALILGRPANGVRYSPDDVDQLLYPSDRLSDILWGARSWPDPAVRAVKGTGVSLAEAVRYPSPISAKAVEDALRHIADYGYLGDHTLARFRVVRARVALQAVTHIDVGKALHSVLAEAIEKLRPGAEPPPDPLPRDWYPYVILHDAYLEGISNRDIMSRLYISEGTFNRTRRAALLALARALEEMEAAAA